MSLSLAHYSRITEIVGDIIKVQVPEMGSGQDICFGDLALVEDRDENRSLAQIIGMQDDQVSLQLFNGTKGVSTASTVRFLGHPMETTYSGNILGRIFRGTGESIDDGSSLTHDQRVAIGGPSANPMRRVLASKMIRTDVPMIDVFNSLVESQKIPIFSVSGEPFNRFLSRVGIQADADIVVFGGMGLILSYN